MQTVHATKYMVRTLAGHYAKTDNNEGVGYQMFNTRKEAKKWAEDKGIDNGYVVKVRAAITPIDTGRAERLVAIREAQSKALSAKHKVEHNFFP